MSLLGVDMYIYNIYTLEERPPLTFVKKAEKYGKSCQNGAKMAPNTPKPFQNGTKIVSGLALRASWETAGPQIEKKTRF